MVERTVGRERETRLAYSTGAKPAPRESPPAPASEPAAGKGGIRLRLERRASGRVVTLVTGLPGTTPEVTALARALKSACGAGGTVKEGALELQGDHRERIEALLAARGVRSKRSGG